MYENTKRKIGKKTGYRNTSKERGNEKNKEKNSTGRNTISPIINVQINDLSLILTFSTLWSLKYIANRTKLAC